MVALFCVGLYGLSRQRKGLQIALKPREMRVCIHMRVHTQTSRVVKSELDQSTHSLSRTVIIGGA